MPERIQVSGNVELKDKIIDHGVDLLNMNQLSNSQRRELQRFIDANSHLLNISDKEREEKEKKEKKQNRYHGPGTARLNLSSSASEYGTGRKPVLGSLNRISSPSSEYGTGKRKEVSWSDGVRARSHSPTNDGSGMDPSRFKNNRDSGYGSGYGYGDPYGDNQSNPYSSLDRSSRDGSRDRDRSRSKERRGPNWEKPWIGNFGSKEDVSGGDKSWFLKERELSPAYSSLPRHPDDYNRYETRKYIVKELERTKRDDTAKFYGYGDRVGSGIELTPKRWKGGEIIKDPTFIKKSIKPRRLFYSPIGDGVVEADGIEMKRGPKDMTPKRYVTHERYAEGGNGGHGGVNLYETRWANGGDDGNDRGGKGDDGYGGYPYDGMGDNHNKPSGPSDNNNGKKGGDGGPFGPRGDGLDDWPRSGRSSALSIGTDGYPRQGWTKTFITNPRELIHQYGNETLTNIFDLEDHTPKTLTTTKEVITNEEVEGPLV